MQKRPAKSEMKKGVLEILIVNAKGIKHTNLIGTPAYFVETQCGNKVHKTKVSSENEKVVWWNDKFEFEFPVSDWRYLNQMELRIMGTELFSDGGFVGETRIHIGGIVAEGIGKGIVQVKPTPFNVVLQDGTYKGEIIIGLKFFINKVGKQEKTASMAPQDDGRPTQPLWGFIINLFKILWSKFRPN